MRVSISSGHTANTGAQAHDGTDEWSHNERLRRLVVKELEQRGHVVKTHYRAINKSYYSAMKKLAAEIKIFRADVCLELHFNSASPKAHGYEFLYYRGSKKGKLLALCLSSTFGDMFAGSIQPRRGTGILPRGRVNRGSAYLRLTPCPAVIYEPGFASNPKEWGILKATLYGQAIAIADGLESYCHEEKCSGY